MTRTTYVYGFLIGFILLGFIFSFQFWFNLLSGDTNVVALCANPDLGGKEAKISCEKAAAIALAKYKGQLLQVHSGSGFQKVSGQNDFSDEGQDVWRLIIRLDISVEQGGETFDSVNSFIDRNTGEELDTFLFKTKENDSE